MYGAKWIRSQLSYFPSSAVKILMLTLEPLLSRRLLVFVVGTATLAQLSRTIFQLLTNALLVLLLCVRLMLLLASSGVGRRLSGHVSCMAQWLSVVRFPVFERSLFQPPSFRRWMLSTTSICARCFVVAVVSKMMALFVRKQITGFVSILAAQIFAPNCLFNGFDGGNRLLSSRTASLSTCPVCLALSLGTAIRRLTLILCSERRASLGFAAC